MGYDGASSVSGVVTASTLNTITKEMELTINGGIGASDLDASNWVKSIHVKPLRFFGSPAPRVEGVSGDVHFRTGGGGDNAAVDHHHTTDTGVRDTWRPIPGLSATIHVKPPIPTQDISANILATWFANELGGVDSTVTSATDQQKSDVCHFALFIVRGDTEPSYIQGTQRWLYRGHSASRAKTQNHNVVARVDLVEGINHIYIACRMSETVTNRGRVHVGHRSLVVDVKYL
jgi:hypothetical protein